MSGNDKVGIVLAKGDHKLVFDIPIRTKEGVLWCINMQRKKSLAEGETALASTTKTPTYNITKAHSLLGHMSEDATRKASKNLGWTITRGTLKPCESCGIGKARQRNLEVHHSEPGEIGDRWYIDGMKLKKTNRS